MLLEEKDRLFPLSLELFFQNNMNFLMSAPLKHSIVKTMTML